MQNSYHILGVEYEYAIALVAGMTAAFTITPIITIVDKSVMLSANGKKNLTTAVYEGLKSLLSPIRMARSFQFQWILLVYILTYITSNTSKLMFHSIQFINPAMTALLATFIVNTTSSMIKDKALAQKLGKSKPRPFPVTSLILFLLRDIIAMASAFTIPPSIADEIQKQFDITYETSLKIAQILSPMMVQLITTFIQLFALDLYNRQNQSLKQRIDQVKLHYLSSLAVRIIGFTAAYGIGGIINLEMKFFLNQFFKTI